MLEFIIKYIGFFAAFCTTVAFLPQAIKVYKSKSTKDISLYMFLIFTIGGLVSLEHGIEALSHPKKLENLFISISILSLSIILESYVLVKAVKKLRKNRESKSILKLLKQSNDGPLIAIVVEDFAATLGLIFALIGTLLTYFTGNSLYDAVTAILIGILLMISGVFLGYEMKHLITGETVDINISYTLDSEINKFEKVNKVIKSNLVSVGADKYLAIVHIDYIDSLTDSEIVQLNKDIQIQIIDIEPRFLHLYLIPA